MDFLLFAKDSSRSHFALLEWETLRSVVHYTHSMLAYDDGRFNPKFWFGFSNRQNTFCKWISCNRTVCTPTVVFKNNKTKNTKNARAWYGWLNELRCKKNITCSVSTIQLSLIENILRIVWGLLWWKLFGFSTAEFLVHIFDWIQFKRRRKWKGKQTVRICTVDWIVPKRKCICRFVRVRVWGIYKYVCARYLSPNSFHQLLWHSGIFPKSARVFHGNRIHCAYVSVYAYLCIAVYLAIDGDGCGILYDYVCVCFVAFHSTTVNVYVCVIVSATGISCNHFHLITYRLY